MVPTLQFGELVLALPCVAALFTARLESVRPVWASAGLSKQLLCAGSPTTDGHGNVSVLGDENDGHVDICMPKSLLEIQPAQVRQAHIEHDASGRVRKLCHQKLPCRTERSRPKSNGSDQS